MKLHSQHRTQLFLRISFMYVFDSMERFVRCTARTAFCATSAGFLCAGSSAVYMQRPSFIFAFRSWLASVCPMAFALNHKVSQTARSFYLSLFLYSKCSWYKYGKVFWFMHRVEFSHIRTNKIYINMVSC